MVIRLRGQSSRIVVSGAMVLAFLLVSWGALRPWVAQRVAGGEPADAAARRALAIDPGNDRIRATLAALYHFSLLFRDYHAALISYRSILRNNPLDSASWLHIGRLYEKLSQQPEADQAFRLAIQLDPSNAALLWEIAVDYLDQEQAPKTLDTLARFLSVANNPSDLAKGYELAHRLLTPEEVLNNLIPPHVPDYKSYVHYLLDHNLGDQTPIVWSRLNEMATRTGESIDADLQLRIVDLLTATGKFETAYRVWNDVTKQIEPDAATAASNLVSNAGFERGDTIGRGFDWRIGSAPGVAADLDPFTAHTGRRSLKLSFTKSRADFSNVSQLVPVQPDSTYALQAYIRTDLPVPELPADLRMRGVRPEGLAKSQRIAIEAIDAGDTAVATTDAIGGTRDWTVVAAQFRTSGDARTVTLRIHSTPPPAYLPPLSGSAWIDNVSLTKVE